MYPTLSSVLSEDDANVQLYYSSGAVSAKGKKRKVVKHLFHLRSISELN